MTRNCDNIQTKELIEMIAAIVIAIVVLAILLWAVVSYNSFIKLANKAEEADAGIDAELKKRYDLVPNLVETVKGYAAHESSTLEAVITARNNAVNAEPARQRKTPSAVPP